MNIVADLHTHSVASGHAYCTVLEMAKAAREKKLQLMALTDHGPAMPGGPHLYHFGNMRVLPRTIEGVEIFRGVEANIIDHEGSLDMPEVYLLRLDIVLAGLHTFCYPGGTVEENTSAVKKTMANPFVDIIVHPGNPEFPLDSEQILREANKQEIAVEINNSSLIGSRKGSRVNCERIAELAAEYGNILSFGSDAHFNTDIGRFEDAIEMVMKAGVKEEQILNLSVDRIKAYLSSRRAKRAVSPGN